MTPEERNALIESIINDILYLKETTNNIIEDIKELKEATINDTRTESSGD